MGWEEKTSGESVSQDMVLGWLEKYKGKYFRASELSELLGLRERTVYKSLQRLSKSGFVDFKPGLFCGRPVKFYFFREGKVLKKDFSVFLDAEDSLRLVLSEVKKSCELITFCEKRKDFKDNSKNIFALKRKIEGEVLEWGS